MTVLIGIAMALALCTGALMTGLGRERSFYPTMVMVIASYYVLFAVQAGGTAVLLSEILALAIFSILAVVGFRSTIWLVVAALAGHGAFDLFHGYLIGNTGVPMWWPSFCLAFDFTAACCFAVQLFFGKSMYPYRAR